jgi:FKBP-type peptidyl-prolyl cis-trans isomerase FkpA
MKYLIPLFFSLVMMASSCTKTCNLKQSTTKASTTEIAALKTYLDGKSITATQHANGFFYVIKNAGTGNIAPALCDAVSVKYTGTLLNGTIFDSATTPQPFDLNRLILSWQMAIPLIKKGGSITIYTPASLAYGSQAIGPIPANSALIFDIDLVDFN